MVSGLSSTKFERLHVAHPAQSSDMIETYRSSTSAPELLEVHANKGWNEELAAQQELKKLRRKSLETEEQLEEMIRRVAMVSKDKSDINSQITALTKEKQALARKLGMHLATQAIRTLKPNQ
eukprot:gene16385-22587_t